VREGAEIQGGRGTPAEVRAEDFGGVVMVLQRELVGDSAEEPDLGIEAPVLSEF